MSAYFLSDIHLKSVNEKRGQILISFLRELSEISNADTHLFLLGDIFDLWISSHDYFVQRYQDVVEPIRKIKSSGANIYYFEGNHDLHLHEFWQNDLGAKVYTSATYFQIEGLNIRCEHGDEINQEDLAYLRLRRFVRHPLMAGLGHRVSGKVWQGVGSALSQISRKKSHAYRFEREEELRRMIRQHAQEEYVKKPFDVIISGHMHTRDEYEFESLGKKILSFNLGSWFEKPNILVLENGQFNWRELS